MVYLGLFQAPNTQGMLSKTEEISGFSTHKTGLPNNGSKTYQCFVYFFFFSKPSKLIGNCTFQKPNNRIKVRMINLGLELDKTQQRQAPSINRN